MHVWKRYDANTSSSFVGRTGHSSAGVQPTRTTGQSAAGIQQGGYLVSHPVRPRERAGCCIRSHPPRRNTAGTRSQCKCRPIHTAPGHQRNACPMRSLSLAVVWKFSYSLWRGRSVRIETPARHIPHRCLAGEVWLAGERDRGSPIRNERF